MKPIRNLFVSELTIIPTGNDPDLDSDREESPIRVHDPPGPRTGKRNPANGERPVKTGRGADKPRGGGGAVTEANESGEFVAFFYILFVVSCDFSWQEVVSCRLWFFFIYYDCANVIFTCSSRPRTCFRPSQQ